MEERHEGSELAISMEINTRNRGPGHRNSGRLNAGDHSSGPFNSGHRDSDHRNNDHHYPGYYNVGDHIAGIATLDFTTLGPTNGWFQGWLALQMTSASNG